MRKFITTTILVSFFMFNLIPYVRANDTAKEVQIQIKNINDQIKELDKEIADFKNKIAKTSEEADSLSRIIRELTLTRDKLLKERTQIEKKISATGLIIKELSGNIETKEEIIINSKEVISRMIYDLYKEDNISILENILGEKDFESMSREYNDRIELNNKLKEKILELNGEKKKLIETKSEKLDEQDKLTALKKALLEKEQAVNITQKEKNKILTDTKNKEAEYQKLLKETEKRKQVFEKEMEDYEAQLELLINPKFLPKEGSGALLWPLDSILITSKYGTRINPFNSAIKSFHYGIDFRASVGTKVKASANGVVVGTGNTDVACQGASFGGWVLVKYNNGLSSTYGHLSSRSVVKGQKVKAGDTIGLSGGAPGAFGSGSSTGPHLHLSVYASDGVEIASFESKSCPGKMLIQPRITRADAHLDPLLYLPQTTKTMFK